MGTMSRLHEAMTEERPEYGPLTKEEQEEADYWDGMAASYRGQMTDEEWAAYEAYEAESLAQHERECGVDITVGPDHDPYGASCELDKGHDGPHRSADPFGGDGHVTWFGGGTCVGDPLPIRDFRFVAGAEG
jgi:hypothetical protein